MSQLSMNQLQLLFAVSSMVVTCIILSINTVRYDVTNTIKTENDSTNSLKSLVTLTSDRPGKINETSSSTTLILQNGSDKNETKFLVTRIQPLHKPGKERNETVISSIHLAVLQPTWVKAPHSGERPVSNCDVPCFITGVNTVETLNRSDAVIFMLPSFNLNDPNFVLKKRGVDPTSVIKVGMTLESLANCPQEFGQISKYDIEFSYRQSSDVFYPYFRDRLLRPVSKWSTRKSAIAFVANNCNSNSHREKLVKLLQKYVPVDSVSGCLHNTEWPKTVPKSNKVELLERYKVYLAAENSIAKDYVSEKVFDGLDAGAVPIYLGAPNVEEFIPTNSTIIVPAYFKESDIVKIAQTVKEIFNDEAEYERWTNFKHHDYEEWLKKKFSFTSSDPLCRLCRRVITLKEGYDWDRKSQQIVWSTH